LISFTVRITGAATSMVHAYWNIGRLIVEQEQNGELKAGYGDQLLERLSKQLQVQYGRGFTLTNFKVHEAVLPAI
jgi:hypothetical protein